MIYIWYIFTYCIDIHTSYVIDGRQLLYFLDMFFAVLFNSIFNPFATWPWLFQQTSSNFCSISCYMSSFLINCYIDTENPRDVFPTCPVFIATTGEAPCDTAQLLGASEDWVFRPLFWGWSLKEFPEILSERTTWEVLVTIWPEFYGCFAYVFQIDCWCNCWIMFFFQERGYDEWFFIGVTLGWHVYCRMFRLFFAWKNSVWIRTYDLEVKIVLDCQAAATTKERYGFARLFTDLSRGHPKMP